MRTPGAADFSEISEKPERSGDRRRVLKAGTISYGGHFVTTPCTVRDIATRGARLSIDTPAGVPDTFRLTIELDGLEVDCEVVWRRSGQVGVRFQSQPRAFTPRRLQVVASIGAASRPSLRRQPR